jgi:hypothetical protein
MGHRRHVEIGRARSGCGLGSGVDGAISQALFEDLNPAFQVFDLRDQIAQWIWICRGRRGTHIIPLGKFSRTSRSPNCGVEYIPPFSVHQ